MTRGARQDIPITGACGIERDGLIKPWEYWEGLFQQEFSEAVRRELQNIRAGFFLNQGIYEHSDRTDAKQLDRNLRRLQRSLQRAEKKKSIDDSEQLRLENAEAWGFVERTTIGITGKSPIQLIDIAREELKLNRDEVLMSPVEPKNACAAAIYDLLKSNDLNVTLSSSDSLACFPKCDPYPKHKPVEELICCIVLGVADPAQITAGQITRIKKAIQRHKET